MEPTRKAADQYASFRVKSEGDPDDCARTFEAQSSNNAAQPMDGLIHARWCKREAASRFTYM